MTVDPHVTILDVLADLMKGGRHSRTTVARTGPSLPTADRWLKQLRDQVPGVRAVRDGKTTWYEWQMRCSGCSRVSRKTRRA